MAAVRELVKALLVAAEKGQRIAREIRADEVLFAMLVEEKEADKNERFDHDFKTLADVLIQQMLTVEVARAFPAMRDHVLGEESNQFTNSKGEAVTIAVGATEAVTAATLARALAGSDKADVAAARLAALVHETPEVTVPAAVAACEATFDDKATGIWIDPIDGTNEFLKGGEVVSDEGIALKGLPVVTVLVGAFDRTSGEPIVGVIGQPYANKGQGRLEWGICAADGTRLSSFDGAAFRDNAAAWRKKREDRALVVTSGSERKDVLSKLDKMAQLLHPAGAGFKLLLVLDGTADAFVGTKGSFFRWDTCAAHAILRACGGDMVRLPDKAPIPYHEQDDGSWAVTGKVVAYLSESMYDSVKGVGL